MKLPVLFSEVPNKRPPMFIFGGESNDPLPLLRSLLGPSLFLSRNEDYLHLSNSGSDMCFYISMTFYACSLVEAMVNFYI